MSIRLTPQAKDLFRRFSPSPAKEVTPPVQAASDQPQKVTARLESTQEGVCPYCSKPMRRSKVAIGDVWLCEDDRHVVPLRNPS